VQTRGRGQNLPQQSQLLARKTMRKTRTQIGRAPGGRIMAHMTRTQTRTYGVITPSTRQPLLAAMRRAFAWLVSNVASAFGLITNRTARDWHTDDARKDQLPTPNDKQQETQRTCSVILGLVPRIPVASTQGTTPYSHATKNDDIRHTAAYDFVGGATSTIWKRVQGTRVPRAGGDPVSAHRALLTRAGIPPCHSGRRRSAPQTRNPGATRALCTRPE